MNTGLEKILSASSKLLIIPIILSLAAFIIMIALGCIDIFKAVQSLFVLMLDYSTYTNKKILDYTISAIDAFLIGTVFFIFSYGLYKLFFTDPLDKSQQISPPFTVNNLEDLKDSLGKTIILAMVISFFGSALELEYHDIYSLIYLAISILVIAGALLLTKNIIGKTTKD